MTLIEENQRLRAEVEKLQADFNRLAEQTTDVWVVEKQSGDEWIPAEYRNDKPHSYCERFSILLQAPHWRWRNTLTGQIETSGSYCFPDPKAEMEKELALLRAIQHGFAPETLPYPLPKYTPNEVDAAKVMFYREFRAKRDEGLTVSLKATLACYEKWYEEMYNENKALKDELRRVSDEYADASTYLEHYAKEHPIVCDRVEELEKEVAQLKDAQKRPVRVFDDPVAVDAIYRHGLENENKELQKENESLREEVRQLIRKDPKWQTALHIMYKAIPTEAVQILFSESTQPRIATVVRDQWGVPSWKLENGIIMAMSEDDLWAPIPKDKE